MTERGGDVSALSVVSVYGGRRPRGRARLAHWTAAAVLAIVAAACASKTAPPATNLAPRYPDFVFPAIPAGMVDPAGRHARGWGFLQAGDLRQAERELTAALKQAPALFPAEAALGYVELARDDQKAAVARFDRALARMPGYAPALVGRGEALLGLKRDSDALASFEAALMADATLGDVGRRIEVLRFRAVQQNLDAAREAAAEGRVDEAIDAYTRALSVAPDSAPIYRSLAALERGRGDSDQALGHFRRVVELEPTDAASFIQIGEILDAQGDLIGAIGAFTAASAIDPSPPVDDRIATLRARLALAAMPDEYQAIPRSAQLSRAEMAALIGVRLKDLIGEGRRDAIVATDTRNSWAQLWIDAVLRAGVMDVYDNHTFQPRAPVRRGDLAQAVSRLLTLVAARRPATVRAWQGARVQIADVDVSHLGYPAASVAAASGVMPLFEGNTFQLARPVSGAEAIEIVGRVEALAGLSGQAAAGPGR